MGGEFEPVCGVDLGVIVGLLKLLIDLNLFLVTSILLFKSNKLLSLGVFFVCILLRLSRDEKLYQKELEAALKASIEDSQLSSGSSTTHDNQEEFSDDEVEVASSKLKKPRLLPPLEIEDNNKENNV